MSVQGRVYGTTCTLCGELMLRGAGDADVCTRCSADMETVDR